MEGINRNEFLSRREKLMNLLPSNSLVVIPGYSLRYASGAVLYEWINFFLLYLSY